MSNYFDSVIVIEAISRELPYHGSCCMWMI